MNKKAFLLFLLLTPLIVIVSSTLAFRFGFGPEATKNNGIFFDEFTDISEMQMLSINNYILDFEDGKWVMGIYHNEEGRTLENSRLMKQLNVALNRDINRVKRILFFEAAPTENFLENIKNDFPRQEIFIDSELRFKDLLLNLSGESVISSSYIFIIDPYGRLVMYFPNDLTPKKILKDLKVLI
jgi:hypothetical protein|tara:strand:- start:173 stop:724 length:552 start_codon:yes stop_codon:yes gene_type:complete